MPTKLSYFAARGVFGDRDYTLRFSDEEDALIIVGPNGTGKSTLINLYYFFISKQWSRLATLDFRELEIGTSNGESISVNSTDLVLSEEKLTLPTSFRRYYQRLTASGALRRLSEQRPLTPALTRRISEETDVPERALVEISNLLRHEPTLFHANLAETEQRIDALDLGVILYLPTFRRIEKNLDFTRTNDSETARSIGAGHIELVKSGMLDVNNMIREYIGEINSQSRKSVTRAFQEFIREMLRGQINEFSVRRLQDEDPEAIAFFISSLDDDLLTEIDKKRLLAFVEKEKHRKKGKPKIADQYMGYFVSKMISVFADTRELERPLIEFLGIVTRYLTDKLISYDNREVNLISPSGKVPLDDLSSGEKQIVAVFAYLLLSSKQGFTVIIDEPELSLSVPWQRTFLPDILQTGRCKQLLAVTHSPFIFDNDLQNCVVDVQGLVGNE